MNQLIRYIKSNKITNSRVKWEVRDEQSRKLPYMNSFVLSRKYARDFFHFSADELYYFSPQRTQSSTEEYIDY